MNTSAARTLEWTSVLLNIGYAYLLGRQLRMGWLFGFVASSLGVLLYAVEDAWLMAALNVFYAIMGLYGWWSWGRPEVERTVVRWSVQRHGIMLLLTGIGMALLLAGMHAMDQPGRFLGMEAFIASSAMVATWMMGRKVLENWIYWMVGDAVGVVYNHLIGYSGYALLNVVYIGLAVYGFMRWRRQMDMPAGR